MKDSGFSILAFLSALLKAQGCGIIREKAVDTGECMRKTEIGLGVTAGTVGIVLAVLSMLSVLPYSTKDVLLPHDAASVQTYAVILLAANVLGVAGAIAVSRHHVLGSLIMLLATFVVLIFGFPWQSITAVIYIISVVLALVPVKIEGIQKYTIKHMVRWHRAVIVRKVSYSYCIIFKEA